MTEAGRGLLPRSGFRLAVLVSTFLVPLLACDDPVAQVEEDTPARSQSDMELSPSAQMGQGRALPTRPELREYFPEVRVDGEFALEAEDGPLDEAVEKAGGTVHIGFKPPSAQPTIETGVIPAMTREEVIAAQRDIEAAGAIITRTFATIAAAVATISPDRATALLTLPRVNYVAPASIIPLQSLAQEQDTSWGVHKIRAPQTWGHTVGENAAITILDSGVDQDHFTSGDGPARLSSSDCLYDPAYFTSCWDDIPHGTHVAGIIAALNNEYGVIGIAHYGGIFGQPLASVRICGNNGCPTPAIVLGLDWVANNGRARQIVNMSFGAHPDSLGFSEKLSILSAVQSAYDAGNLLVGAAGNDVENNDPPVSLPAAFSEVIAVSGTLPDDSFADWITCPIELRSGTIEAGSNFGDEVELSAPFWARSLWENGQYEVECGTSMAAPVVSSVAALVWSEYPSITRDQLRTRLQNTAVDLPPAGRDERFGYGRVDALDAVGPVTGDPPSGVAISGPTLIEPEATCLWEGSVTGGTTPFSYEWKNDGIIVSNTDSYTGGKLSGTLGPSFTLRFTVTNDAGSDWTEITVTEDESAPMCFS